MSGLNSIPTCYATVSIGFNHPHSLVDKLEAISSAGFDAIELGFPDLLGFSKEFLGRDVQEDDYDSLCEAGEEVQRLCKVKKLKILVLQPFFNFEGWEEGSKERKDAFTRAEGWIRIMQAVGTDILQVGASDSPNISSSKQHIASDLQALAALLSPHNFKLAYENWCWATNSPTWSAVWEIVQLVDRPNVGLCLDTFQTAGSEWADPTSPTGLLQRDQEELERAFKESLARLAQSVPKEKIFFFQISDAYKPDPSLEDAVVDGLRPRGRWSHDYRPLPFEGGYLPVVQVVKAVLATGYRGWFSTEIFDGGKDGKGKQQSDQADLKIVARRAMDAHQRLLEECARD